jgi:hypothetical protein
MSRKLTTARASHGSRAPSNRTLALGLHLHEDHLLDAVIRAVLSVEHNAIGSYVQEPQ